MTTEAEAKPTVFKGKLVGLRGEDRGQFEALAPYIQVQDPDGKVYARGLGSRTSEQPWTYREITFAQVKPRPSR